MAFSPFRLRNARRRSPAIRLALCGSIASLLAVQARALTIVPTWDSTITSDPNAAAIEADINSMIAIYQADFKGTNLTYDVTISESSSVEGAENIPFVVTETYSAYRAAIQSHATTLDSVAVNKNLTPTNPINGSNTVEMSRANAAALGFSVTTNGDGSITTGSLILGTDILGSTAEIKQAFAHEFDEELGTISGVGDTNVWSIDFTRYSAAGAHTFTTSTSTHAYFSIDGQNMLAEYNQFNHIPGDWGDFALSSVAHVQDFAISGSTTPAIELRMLNSVGYGYTGQSISNAFATNVLNTVAQTTVSTNAGSIPNVPSNDVLIVEGAGTGVVTLGATPAIVNSLTNTATATAVTVSLAGGKLVAGNGAVDAGTGLIELGVGATNFTIGSAPNDGTVTAGSSTAGAYTLGLINAGGNSSVLDIKSTIVDNGTTGGVVSIIVLNTGKVVLEGTNTYTGTTTIGSGATLQVGNGGSTGTLGNGGAVEIDGALNFNRSGTVTISGALSGAGPITQAGTGTVVFSGVNSAYTGTFTINSGATLQFGAGGTTGDPGSGTVTNNGTLVFDRSDSFTLSAAISGTGTLTQAGTGTLTVTSLTAANVVAQSGVLQVGGSLNYTGGVSSTGGTFQLAGSSTLGGGAYSTAITDNGLLEFSTTANQTISGVISGSGGLTKDTTSSTLTLTQKNTYTGATTVNTGTLALNFSSGAATNILAATSTLVVGNGAVTFTGASGVSAAQTLAGTTITGTVGSLNLVQNGATSLVVTLGPLTFNAGSSISFNGATGTTVGAQFKTTTGTAGAMLGFGAMYDGTDWAAKDATNAFIVAYTGYTNVYTGTAGSQTVVIPNSSTADVKILENGSAGAPNTLASSTTTIDSLIMSAGTTSSTISMGGGTLVINGGASVTGAVAIATGAKALTIGTTANDGSLTAGASGASTLSLINNTASAFTVNSVVKNNLGAGAVSVTVSGSGTVTFDGTNTYTGSTSIGTGATLQLAGAGALGSGTYAGAVVDNGTLRLSSSATQAFSGIISGAGGVTKDTNTSTVTLTGANTFTGGISVAAGTLQIGGAGSLGGGNFAGTIAVASGGTLNETSSVAQTYSGVISGAGAINNSNTLTITGTSNTFTGTYTVNSGGTLAFGSGSAVGGTGAKIAVTSGGVLDLSGQNIATAYSATIAGTGISSGGAIVNSGSVEADLANVTLSGNTTLAPGAQNILLGSITATQGSLNLAGFTLTMNGTGTLVLNGLSLTGAGNIVVNSGTLQLMDAYGSSGATQETTTIAGTGTITVNSGASLITPRWFQTLTLSMPIVLNGGTLGSVYPGVGFNSMTISSPISLTANSFLNFNPAVSNYGNVTLSGVISGSFGLTINGDTNIRTLTGVNTYTGATTLNDGTLAISGSGSLGSGAYAGAIAMAQGTTLSYSTSANQTLSGVISGAGALTQSGTGKLTVSATNTYTGATTLTQGTLVVSGSISQSSGATVSGGTLMGTGVLPATTISSGGTIEPGSSTASGLLQSGNFTESSGGHLLLELGGTTGAGTAGVLYSELTATGAVSLAGDVQVSLFGGYTPHINDIFYIILNDGSDAVTGTFSNATGGILFSDGIEFQVSYAAKGDAGSTGNDVSLTVLAVPEPGPGTLMCLGLTLAGLLPRVRRKRV